MLEGACIRACATQGCGPLELGLAACQCLRGHASELTAQGWGLLEFGLAALQPMLEGACIRAWRQEGGKLVVLGDEGAWMAGMGPNAGPTCAQHIHPSLRQTPRVAMLKGLLFRFDTPYVLANVCEAVPETMHLSSKCVLQI
jgi:hypothetical protein